MQPISLVKFANPILITSTASAGATGGKDKGTQRGTIRSSRTGATSPGSAASTANKRVSAAPSRPTISDGSAAPPPSSAEDILNSILPPREWLEDGQLWVQRVSTTPATRADVLHLQEEIERNTVKRRAKETGICSVRAELYSQLFDEVIRQVTIVCAERGMLLLRVRNQLRQSVAAYQQLYESSIAFGMRKALQAEHRRLCNEEAIKRFMMENKELQDQIDELKEQTAETQQSAAQIAALEVAQHDEEIAQLRLRHAHVKKKLEGILVTGTAATVD
eukprot:GHVT01060852.1.p1 GENE.GHVT01060852.1~~GHVT01060852.1.p1  ORF type:complete len:277 (+),score=40.99 GHVT01060852.1:1039-1869(+)